MQTIFLILIFFKLFASILSAFYAVRIARLRTTETRGWMIVSVAFFAMALGNLVGLSYLNETIKTLVNYHNEFIFSYQAFYQALEGIAVILFLITISRSFYRLKRINPIV
ncbi:MAG: hypothetical protein ACR2N3_17820 [Pyrinomonadaceae bacterium]